MYIYTNRRLRPPFVWCGGRYTHRGFAIFLKRGPYRDASILTCSYTRDRPAQHWAYMCVCVCVYVIVMTIRVLVRISLVTHTHTYTHFSGAQPLAFMQIPCVKCAQKHNDRAYSRILGARVCVSRYVRRIQSHTCGAVPTRRREHASNFALALR